MADYKNFIQLQFALNNKIALALDNTMGRLLTELQNIIEEVVYGWKSPSSNPWSPNRTGQFLDSWQKSYPTLIGNIMTGEISQAIEIMKQDMIGNIMVHQDRDNLADIIESGDGYEFGSCTEERDYWNPFMKYVDENLEDIFFEECIKLNLPLTRAFKI